MPDITQPDTLPGVQRRLEGQAQGGKDAPREQPSKKVAETYQEVARSKPLDDRITILGIPVEQITPVTQAALAGLVAEINHLRNVVIRHERTAKRGGAQASNAGTVLEPEAFSRALGGALAASAGEGNTWVVALVHVSTYEDIRRSSGLLAANSALADVAYRLSEVRLSGVAAESIVPSDTVPAAVTPAVTQSAAPVSFTVIGYAGGSNLAGLAALPRDDLDTAAVAKHVRTHLASSGYVVGGIDMALAITVAAAAVGSNESPLLALGRVDHLLRTH